jgi:predicted PurR-regulated permease PerM
VKRAARYDHSARLLKLVAAVVVIAALYFARIVFFPLALALLFSLVLNPAVAFLERIRLPRVMAIFLVVAFLFGVIGGISWKASQQFIDLSNQLPTYKTTLLDKIHTLKGSGGQSFNKAKDTVNDIEKELSATAPGSPNATANRKPPAPQGSTPDRPVSVQVVPPQNPLESMHNMLGPLSMAGAVLIFTIFILVGREDLRNRLIRLVAGDRLNLVTQAMDEATRRIVRYLILQVLVNAGFGLVIGFGLHFLNIPNAPLWGMSAAVLRFLPYIGPPLSALMPIVLSLAVFPEWQHALLTAGLFLVLELLIANVVEPLLYSAHVGMSPLAILVAAIFWTLIWGFPGLVLSTPLTACLVVMGRYIPSLSFLNVLFGDEPVLPPQAQFYQRLLAADQEEARQVLESELKEKSLQEVYSSVVIPALNLAEQDRHKNELDEDTQNFICQSTRELIEELGDPSNEKMAGDVGDEAGIFTSDLRNGTHNPEVLCIPARDDADDIVAMLLAQLLESEGHTARSIPIGTTSEMLAQVTSLTRRWSACRHCRLLPCGTLRPCTQIYDDNFLN